ncbi:predicted protein [Histoplasma capsulatum H143]|uniref:Uncharacterized protein n=1 Tax=Ajellomyces capsulatus (strain H143) TaxID=544712 RepID=C6H348_AJECH|nr:predicted protein [Histoplasma capsulatum H143]
MTLHFVLDFSPEELWPDDLYTIREREDPLLCKQLEKIVPRSLRLQKVNLFSWIHMILNLCKLVEAKSGHDNRQLQTVEIESRETRTVHRSKGRAVVLGRKELGSGGERRV